MKTTLLFVLLAAAGCASSGNAPVRSESVRSESKIASSGAPLTPPKRLEKKPELGMSREEIRVMFNKPKTITKTQEGEIWKYDNAELMLIPFNLGWRPKQHLFKFDLEGRLVEFSMDDF